jgi:uncharacterized protein
MVKTRIELVAIIKRYARELERLGLSVDRIILFGSYRHGKVSKDSDIDLAIFSEDFGGPNHLELSGILSEAKWNTEPMIQAIGFHPSALKKTGKLSFLNEILRTGQIVFKGGKKEKKARKKIVGKSH